MSFSTLSISPVPSQLIQSTLNAKKIKIWIRQLKTGLYCDISADGIPIVQGVLCLNKCWIIRDATSGMNGDFCFIDTQENEDPTLDGLGTRFLLIFRNDLS